MSPPARPLVLGLETSCDETSAAVLDGDHRVLGHVILSQDEHEVFGGVVPELAARAHLQRIDAVVDEALSQAGVSLDDMDLIAAAAGPGLIGALLVGVCWAKAAAFALGRPFVRVHHLEAHLFAPSLEDPRAIPPFVALLVSGGHTLLLHVPEWGEYHLLGETRDDAAGEAFDKVAKLLGLGYPGGPQIEKLSESGNGSRHRFPRPMLKSGGADSPGYFDFSFSGLKTAVVELVRAVESDGVLGVERPHIAASFQEAAVDVLASKTMRAVDTTGCARVLLAGGVSANARLREVVTERLGAQGAVFTASTRLSVDNGAMIARAARYRFDLGEASDPMASASAAMDFPGLVRGAA